MQQEQQGCNRIANRQKSVFSHVEKTLPAVDINGRPCQLYYSGGQGHSRRMGIWDVMWSRDTHTVVDVDANGRFGDKKLCGAVGERAEIYFGEEKGKNMEHNVVMVNGVAESFKQLTSRVKKRLLRKSWR